MTRSIQQLPNNSTTANVIEVPTNTGFNAGDLVYYQNGDYKGLPNLTVPSSGTFNVTTNESIYGATVSSSYTPQVTNGGSRVGRSSAALIAAYPTATGTSGTNTITVSSNTGISNGQFLIGFGIGTGAIVTNVSGTTITLSVNNSGTVSGNITFYTGNLVQVYWATNPIFRIVSTTGTVVVAPVTMATPNPTNNNIGVVALTGGGFAAYWSNGTNLIYAIYSNTGTLVTASTTDTAFTGISSNVPYAVALPNGGFVLACQASTTVSYKIYTSTGTVTAGLTSGLTVITSGNQIGIAARSDSSFVLFSGTTTTNLCAYAIYSSTGTTVLSQTTFTSTYGPTGAVGVEDATVLLDGTTFVLGYAPFNTAYYTAAFRFLPSGNTLGAETIIPTSNLYYASSTVFTFVKVQGLSNGGFLFAFGEGAIKSIEYVFYTSTGVVASGSVGNALPRIIPGAFCPSGMIPTFVEINGYVNTYFINETTTAPATVYQAQISTSNYDLYNSGAYSQILGQTTASTSGISLTNSTPSAVKLLASNSEVDVITNYASPLTQVSPGSFTSYVGISLATMANGNILCGYSVYASGADYIYVNIYTPALVLINKILVGTTTSSSYSYGLQVAGLSSGKFVVSYLTSNTTIRNVIFSSAYSQVASVTTTSAVTLANTAFSVSAMINDNFIIGYLGTSNYPTYIIYNSAGGIVAGPTIVSSTNTIGGGVAVAGNPDGGFAVAFSAGAGTLIYYFTYNSSYSGVINGSYTVNAVNPKFSLACSPTGMYSISSDSGTGGAPQVQIFTTGSAAISNGTITSASSNTANSNFTVTTFTGNGGLVWFYLSSTTNLNIQGFSSYPFISAYKYPGSNIQNSYPVSTSTLRCDATPSYGNTAVFGYLDNNSFPVLLLFNVLPYTDANVLTSGVTLSAPQAISSSANTPVQNTVLAGVAATTATAGTTGQVIIDGLAQLNSNYSATTATQAFDFQNPATIGVKGIINGRTVILQGNL